MSQRQRVVLLTNYFLYGYRLNDGQLRRDIVIELSDGRVDDLRDYLLEDPAMPTRILANVLEEEFIFENVPHSVGADKKHMLNRKLNQHFRQSDYKRVVIQGRQSEDRRDDEIMYSSVGGSQDLKDLIDLLYELEIPITGVYSAPQLFRRYLQPLLKRKNVLIFTEIDNGRHEKVAVRQSFYHDGKLKLTRVGTIDVDSEEHVHHDVEEALESSRRYLLRERMVEDVDKLEVVFVSATHYLETLSGYSDEAQRHFNFSHIGTSALASLLKLPTQAEHGFEDLLAACEPALFTPAHYASKKSHYFERYRLFKKKVLGCAVAASLLMASSIVYMGFDSKKTHADLDLAGNQVSMIDSQLLSMGADDLDGHSQSVFQIKDAVDTVQKIEAKRTTIAHVLGIVSNSLRDFPAIDIVGISWEAEMREVASASSNDDTGDFVDPAFEEDAEEASVLVATISARKVGSSETVRAMLDNINAFAATIRANEQVDDVVLTRLPVNIKPDEELTGQIVKDEQGVTKNDGFELELVLNHAKG